MIESAHATLASKMDQAPDLNICAMKTPEKRVVIAKAKEEGLQFPSLQVCCQHGLLGAILKLNVEARLELFAPRLHL
jgi:hypothetical protein